MPKLAAAVAATCLFLLPGVPVLADAPLFLARKDKSSSRTWEVRDVVTRSDSDLESPIATLPLGGHLMAWRSQEPLNGYFKLRLRTVAFREEAPTPTIPAIPPRP